jgi:hypothetical protein
LCVKCEAWKDEKILVSRKVMKLGFEGYKGYVYEWQEELKSEEEETVRSWRTIVLEEVMMMDQKRKKEWKRIRI